MSLRETLGLFTPPIVGRVARRIQRGSTANEWEYVGVNWPPPASMRGWNVESVVRIGQSRWPDIVKAATGTGPLTEGGLAAHNTLLCWAYALGRAATEKRSLTFLDWGGGLGQYGLLARSIYPSVAIEYFCRDLPLMAQAGRSLLPDATFYESDEEAFARGYDFVMASGSLHYVSDWRSTLTQLAGSTERYLFVTRQPCVDRAASFVVIQRPATHGYDTEYPGWVMNRGELVTVAADLGLELVREFLTGEQPVVPNAPEQLVYRGFLFERQIT